MWPNGSFELVYVIICVYACVLFCVQKLMTRNYWFKGCPVCVRVCVCYACINDVVSKRGKKQRKQRER